MRGAQAELRTELDALYDAGCNHEPCGGQLLTLAADDELPFTDVAIAAWLKKIFKKGGKAGLHQPSIEAFAQAYYDAINKGYGVEFDELSPEAADYAVIENLRKNVYQFATAKNKNELKLLTEAILDADGKVRTFSEFKKAAAAITDLHRATYMRAEYNLAVAGSQMASKWNDFDDNDLLRYSTAGDARVRPEHAAMDGIVKPRTDKMWDTLYPPNGWNCRCNVEVVLYASITPDDAVPPPDSVPPLLRTNLAKEGLVFPKDHPYYKK